ncbi:MAG: hypothetical protein CL916_11660 [Deltaproteobacteria bacterium]|nr:hypothetical protein [Deltaproteobacteria bacterium]
MAVNTIIVTLIGIGSASSFFLLGNNPQDASTIFVSGCGTIIIIGWILSSTLHISLHQKSLLRTILLLFMSFLLIIMANLIAIEHNHRIDLTQEKRHSLSEQSKSILHSIQEPIEIFSFFPLSSLQEKQIQILAEAVMLETDKISFSFHDPNKEPMMAKQYNITNQQEIIVQKGEEQRRIEDYFSEAHIIQEILSLSKGIKHEICFSTGHQELIIEQYKPLSSMRTILDKLEMQNYTTHVINILEERSIPSSCSTLVIAGPQRDFAPFEIDLIDNHVRKGKNLYVLIDIGVAPILSTELIRFGIILKDNAILELDPKRQVSGGDLSYSVINTSDFAPHPIVKTLATNILFQGIRSVEIDDGSSHSLLTLATSSKQSWAEINYQEGPIEHTSGEDISGPVPIIAIIETEYIAQDAPSKGGRVIVVGSSSLVVDEFTKRSDLGNLDFFLNGISWMSDEQDQLYTRARPDNIQPFMLYAPQLRIVFLVSLILTPLSFLFGALGTWYWGKGYVKK